ncbi:MAG TPA: tetratricopeptide repeat protein, partial [Polyangiaceae bacterium]
RSAKEHAMELKVEEAWMRAETDPSRAQQITSVVVKAISVFPKNPRLRYYLARLHIQASRVDEAVKELERVLELDPTDAQAESELARLLTKKLG